ncbi:MAG: hypothetical protein ACM32E_24060 [Gemmatimonadota bacterium]
MQAELAEAADELYALPPGEFRAARDERADRARAAGDRELAGAIRKLRRPTVSAWLVNRLVRDAGDRVGELLALGGELRDAQDALAGDRLRELSGRRRSLVPALAREARRLADEAGQPVSDQAERELTGTLEAALADPAAAEAVRSGRLATALSYAGLGGTDAFAAVAAPGEAAGQTVDGGRGRAAGRKESGRRRAGRAAGERAGPGRGGAGGRPGRTAGVSGARGRAGKDGAAEGGTKEDRAARAAAERAERAAEAARRDLADAEAAAREAADALAEAEQQAATTAGQHEAAVQRAAELERELDEAQAAEGRTSRAAREARRHRDLAARMLDTAQRRLARARERADLRS